MSTIADGRHFVCDLVELFRAYPYVKPSILFYSIGPAIWHGLSDIRHIEVNNGHLKPHILLVMV